MTHNSSEVGFHNTSNTNSSTEDQVEVEDIILNLLDKSGFLAQLKGEIAKFIQENGDAKPDSVKIQKRADSKILQSIYDYLQWVGMKQTSAVLLSETLVEIDTSTSANKNEEPNLCQMFSKLAAISDVSSSQLQGQFVSPPAFAVERLSHDESTSINIGNRTYTANPKSQLNDSKPNTSNTTFPKIDNSSSLVRSSLYFTPGSTTSFYSANDEEEFVPGGAEHDKGKKEDETVVNIVRLTDETSQVQNDAKSTGEGDFHEDDMLTKSALAISTSHSRSKQELSLNAGHVESSLSSKDPKPTRTEEWVQDSDSFSTKRSKDINSNQDSNECHSPTRSPTFLSPSASSSDQFSHVNQNAFDFQYETKEERATNSHPKPISMEQQEQRTNSKKQAENDDDTLDESMSELVSLSGMNTQDISLTGSVDATDSNDLDSCEHIVNL